MKCFSFLALAFSAGAATAQPSIIADGAVPVPVSHQFSFTEGPAANKKGDVFFTDQPNNRIWKYDTRGRLSLFMENAGRANGLYFDKKGNLLACADERDELWLIDKKGKVNVLLNQFGGHRLNGPNDLWIAPGGGIYFTDPYYQRDYWDRKTTDLDGEKVYYLPGYTSAPRIVCSDLQKPNGIIGTRDGKTLYVADIKANKTYRYTIAANGTLSNKTLFVNQGSDGMTIDANGNVYLCGRGVTVYDPSGLLITRIAIPEKWTANACFGGATNDMLFITASEAIYTLKMNVRGGE